MVSLTVKYPSFFLMTSLSLWCNNRLLSKNVAILELRHSDLVNFLPFIDARNLILRLAVLGKQAVVGFSKSGFCVGSLF